jgi:hypothetical protein
MNFAGLFVSKYFAALVAEVFSTLFKNRVLLKLVYFRHWSYQATQ